MQNIYNEGTYECTSWHTEKITVLGAMKLCEDDFFFSSQCITDLFCMCNLDDKLRQNPLYT